MTILAIYYTLADLVLLAQCFYYRGFTLSDEPAKKNTSDLNEEAIQEEEATEQSPLLPQNRPTISDADHPSARGSSRGSFSSLRSRLSATHVDATHLSPATPFIPPRKANSTPPAVAAPKSRSTVATFFLNISALTLVCAAGVFGWWLSYRSTHPQYPKSDHHHHEAPVVPNDEARETFHFDLWGQIFGYLCAVLYLSSRVPQLLLNHRRKSTEGVSMLFFLFACVGNLTYVMSILAFEPACARVPRKDFWGSQDCPKGEWERVYGRYILLNASWLIGSAGTLVLDLMIFGQLWMYRDRPPQMS